MRLFFLSEIFLILILVTNSVNGQNELDSVSYEVLGNVKVEILYNQYFKEKNRSDTLLSPWGYEVRQTNNPEKLFLVFDCPECCKEYQKNILYIDNYNVKIERLVHHDSVSCCIILPLLETSVIKKYQLIKSQNWELTTEIIDDGCQDTHYSNLNVVNKNGTVQFKNLNNVRVYEPDWFKEKSSVIVVSTRLCRNEIIIYKIE